MKLYAPLFYSCAQTSGLEIKVREIEIVIFKSESLLLETVNTRICGGSFHIILCFVWTFLKLLTSLFYVGHLT